MAKRRLREERPKAPWGAIIPAIFSTAASIWGTSQAAKQQEEALREQKREVERQARLTNLTNQAQTLNNYFDTLEDEPKYYQYKYGGKKKNRGKLKITDGGVGIPIDYDTFLLQGGSHNTKNSSGHTGIGLKLGDQSFEAEDGEIVRKTPEGAVVYSNKLPLDENGTTPVDLILQGENPNNVRALQEATKLMLGIDSEGRPRTRLRSAISSPVERRKAPFGLITPDRLARIPSLFNPYTGVYGATRASAWRHPYGDSGDLPGIVSIGNNRRRKNVYMPDLLSGAPTEIVKRPQPEPQTNVSSLYNM